MPKASDLVKKQLDLRVQLFNEVQLQYNCFFQDSLSRISTIRHLLKKNDIRIKCGGADAKARDSEQPTQSDASSVGNEPDTQENKKIGRPKKVKKKTISEARETDAVLSDSSTSSNRSQRAAAQAAGQKLAQVQNFMKATKLRRPTDFDERQRRCDKAASPPAKSRKTCQKQSAGSSQDSNEINDDENKENNFYSESEINLMERDVVEIGSTDFADLRLKTKCTVSVEKLTDSAIESHLRSGSLESLLHNSTNTNKEINLMERDLVEIGSTDCADLRLKSKCTVSVEKLTDSVIKSNLRSGSLESLLHKNTNRNKENGFSEKINIKNKNKTVGSEKLVKSSEDMFQIDSKCSLGDKSPLSEGQFKGFDLQDNTVKCNLPMQDTFVIEKHCDSEVNELRINSVKQDVLSKTISALDMEYTEELKQIEMENCRIKDLSITKNFDKTNKVCLNENVYETEKHNDMSSEEEDIQQSVPCDGNRNEIKDFESNSGVNNIEGCKEVINKSSNDECESDRLENNLNSRTTVFNNNSGNECESDSPKNKINSRAKAINKNSNDACESDSPKHKINSRTKVIKKHNAVSENECESDSPKNKINSRAKAINKNSNDECESDSPEHIINSRTKVIKKHNAVSENEYRSQTKTIGIRECNDLESTSLAAMPKEHLLSEQSKLTKEASKGSPIVSKGPVVKKRVEEFENLGKNVRETTGVITRHTAKNRNLPSRAVTPGSVAQTKVHKVNTKLNSATTPVRVEHTAALVQKQALEEVEKKKREEERLKRQAKEEIAIKKKENTLKATVEQARRKREEKLKKAAAAREAAEKEKHMLSRKAEREKEAKIQQIAAEKEKHKEEYLKMKLLAKQKALEHEERRKHEEEARLARLKEQEEEHKRVLAMRERELELKKHVKDNEIRLAESEKAKYKGLKLGKTPSGPSANAKLQHGNPTNQQLCHSYEITPAREDRPLLEPKSENDYGIDHANSGDSSEDESQPKKKIPLWADAKVRYRLLKVNSLLPKEIWSQFMESSTNPDINQIFAGNPIRKRIRTSSAVWNTPPISSHIMHN